MNNFNFTAVEGNLTRDPELKTIAGDFALCKFTIGSNRSYTKKNGEVVKESSFFDITTWAKLAETCAKYLKKGSRVLVSGNLRKDTWKDKDGTMKNNVYVEGKSVNFLSPANSPA